MPWGTKTSAGTRTITLSPSTAELLRERRKSTLTGWIFPNPLKPEDPTRPSTAYDRMKVLLKQAGLSTGGQIQKSPPSRIVVLKNMVTKEDLEVGVKRSDDG